MRKGVKEGHFASRGQLTTENSFLEVVGIFLLLDRFLGQSSS
jgi:hypothetical protein